MISFIVSACDHPRELDCCLASLRVQGGEIVVCDNGLLSDAKIHFDGAKRLFTGVAGARNCYESANMVYAEAAGEWLCFPSDDSMYVARFADIMLSRAEKTGAGLVYCDCVYALGSEQNHWPNYTVLDSSPRMGRIDKTCFIVRRELFTGFPPHPQNYRDGALIEELVRSGVKHAKAPGVLVVHQ